MKMRMIVAGLALAMSGCSTVGSMTSTVGGWFGHGPVKAKPAELVEFKPTVSLLPNVQVWCAYFLPRSAKVEGYKSTWDKLDVTATEDAVEYGTDEYLGYKAASAHSAFTVLGARLAFPIRL